MKGTVTALPQTNKVFWQNLLDHDLFPQTVAFGNNNHLVAVFMV
ncbi:hypothetical protein TH47_16750 [Thalassospira sp. MCCC 1A02803]|nr:hypothetical protein TH47_16750 [Thalassospira sp. MCCC 1A02803]